MTAGEPASSGTTGSTPNSEHEGVLGVRAGRPRGGSRGLGQLSLTARVNPAYTWKFHGRRVGL